MRNQEHFEKTGDRWLMTRINRGSVRHAASYLRRDLPCR
jgi:hypothetical protein